MPIAKLDRTVLRLSGEGVADWLDGLITNSLEGDLTFAAILTPQGKIIADFFVWQEGDLFIDTPSKFGAGLFKRLKMYRLRAPITIEDVSDKVSIFAVWDVDAGVEDPRHEGVQRLKSSEYIKAGASQEDWDAQRLSLGLPDSQWDFETAQTFPHNVNMDRLNGVNFKKGCFVGQEVVSRMQRKTEIRKRLCGFAYEGPLEGAEITAESRIVGEIFYAESGQGMAMVRLDRLPGDDGVLMVGQTPVSVKIPK